MRNLKAAFLSCAVVAATGLLATPAAMATGSSCSSFNPTVTITSLPVGAPPGATGPCPVTSANPTQCAASGPYTGIRYKITGSPDHVATVVTANNVVLSVPGNQFYAACVGDSVTGLGKQSCHERAVKVNPNPYTGEFWLVVDKARAPILQSLAAKKGSCTKSFAVTGLGFEVNPFQTAQKTETVNFKGCAVDFAYDVVTGAVQSAQLNIAQSLPVCQGGEQPGTCCSHVIESDVSNLSLNLNIPGIGPLGAGQFGDGYISSGVNSCTTRVIGGRVYTWGSPCPD